MVGLNMTKFTIISDTHGKHHHLALPGGDILIHCGDFTTLGHKHEIEDFIKWFRKQPYTHKVFIAGNHDKGFDPKFKPFDPVLEHVSYDHKSRKPEWLIQLLHDLKNWDESVIYLENEFVVLNGIKIWGSPITPSFHKDRWAFNKDRGDEIKQTWKQIPLDTDIIITHGPVSYKLDYVPYKNEYAGCEDLRYTVEQVKPILHVCGHIHESYGIEGNGDTTYINASICDLQYQPVNKPWNLSINEYKEIKVEDS